MEILENNGLLGKTGNGAHAAATAVVHDSDWRNRAIQAGLLAESRHGRAEDAMLDMLRTHRPDLRAVLTQGDRERVMDFLHESGRDLSTLVTPAYQYELDEQRKCMPYLGWFAVEWEGKQIEVAFPPDWGEPGEIFVLAADAADADRFVNDMIDFIERPTGRSLRYMHGWQNAPDIDEELGKVTWDDIVLPHGIMERLRESIEGFYSSRETFHALGFPWKRGVLLIGPPGTGKTMVCKAAAAALPDLPFLYVRDLRERTSQDAIHLIFDRARKLAPCILTFEDMDSFVNGGNRSVFLNELDGFKNNDGMLIIASSNHPGKIDEALLKRPSRFDRVFHIGLPVALERAEYCRRLLFRSTLTERLSAELDIEALAERVAERTDGFTPAYLKEAFLSAALERVQKGDLILDETFAEAVLTHVDGLKKHLKKMKNPDALAEMRSGEDPISLRG